MAKPSLALCLSMTGWYGGRQLGKTALLKQLQLQYHKPPHQYILYNSFDDIGEGRTYPVEELWKRVGESMVKSELTATKPTSRKQVEEQILEFLSKNPLSRIIILVDEADYILKSEIQSEYPNIVPIKTRLATMGESGLQHWLMTMTTGGNTRVTNLDAEELKRLTGGFPRYLWDLKKAARTTDILDMASKSRDKRLGEGRLLCTDISPVLPRRSPQCRSKAYSNETF